MATWQQQFGHAQRVHGAELSSLVRVFRDKGLEQFRSFALHLPGSRIFQPRFSSPVEFHVGLGEGSVLGQC